MRLAIVVALALLAAFPAAPPGSHAFARTAPPSVPCRGAADAYHVPAAGSGPRA